MHGLIVDDDGRWHDSKCNDSSSGRISVADASSDSSSRISGSFATFFGPRRPRAAPLEIARTGEEVRAALLSYLRTHRRWYARWSLFYSTSWNACMLAIIILGALSSILTATGELKAEHHWILIVLPAISSLLAALLTQFRLKESCGLRDLGRIQIEELICKAYIIPTDDCKTAMTAAMKVRQEAHALEREQLAKFLAGATPLSSEKTGR